MDKRSRFNYGVFLLMCLWIVSCTKTDEPSHPVGKPLPYTEGANRTIAQLLDSLPDCTFFDAAYKRAGLAAMLDSQLRTTAVPYTIFAPTDDAFKAAGYTLQQIGQMTPAQLDSMVLYWTVAGGYTFSNLDSLQGSTGIVTLLKDPGMKRSLDYPGFSSSNPYRYRLYTAVMNGTLWLNGIPVRTNARSFAATNGVLWKVDRLVEKPVFETYQVLAGDTAYSFYMAAVRSSDSVYLANYTDYYFKDTISLQVQQGQSSITVLAPTNDAFRRAGFPDEGSVQAYISQSMAAVNYGYDMNGSPIQTNMDSILDRHRIGYAAGRYGALTSTVFYGNDFLYNRSVDNSLILPSDGYSPDFYSGVFFQQHNGQVSVHRVDAPAGRAVNIITPNNITTLNGVVHRVDNLLLPTP